MPDASHGVRVRPAIENHFLETSIIGGTFISVEIAFDPVKSAKNGELRGLPFDRAVNFDFTMAIIREDLRYAYPEARYQALGAIGEQICFPDGIRVISLRPASRKERRAWNARQNQGQHL